MHAILVCAGTDGDVFPYVALGARLLARGHRVTLTANESYEKLAAEHGFAFEALVSDAETQELLTDPDLWHPLKCGRVGARWGVRFIRRQYDLLADLASTRESVLVPSLAILAARLVKEKLGRPLASVILQPWMIQSIPLPPVMPFGLTLPRWAPRPLGWIYWRLIDFVGGRMVGRHLN